MTDDARTPAHVADMARFAAELRALAGRTARDAYLVDRVLVLAFEKLSINLGAAASRIPLPDREAIGAFPWRQIIGLRNILAHGYDQVDPETLYRTASMELDDLEATLNAWLAQRDRR